MRTRSRIVRRVHATPLALTASLLLLLGLWLWGGLAAGSAAPAAFLHGRQLPEAQRQDAELVISELVTNALRHGLGDVVVRTSLADGDLRLQPSRFRGEVPGERRGPRRLERAEDLRIDPSVPERQPLHQDVLSGDGDPNGLEARKRQTLRFALRPGR